MRNVREILIAYDVGDHLSDEEMLWLHRAYQRVVDATGALGEKYQLVALDALKNVQATREFLKSRRVAA